MSQFLKIALSLYTHKHTYTHTLLILCLWRTLIQGYSDLNGKVSSLSILIFISMMASLRYFPLILEEMVIPAPPLTAFMIHLGRTPTWVNRYQGKPGVWKSDTSLIPVCSWRNHPVLLALKVTYKPSWD